MVAVKQKFSHLEDGSVDITAWLLTMNDRYQQSESDLLKKAFEISKTANQGFTTFYGQPRVEQGLEMAEILLEMKLDSESAAAAIVVNAIQHGKISEEVIKTQLNENIAKLAMGVVRMDAINNLVNITSRNQVQIDRLRKTLLAMVSDIRVVLIKLAERTTLMRGIKNITPAERKRLAQETMDLYAPLANRLGIGQIKWELEDLAFHYIDPETYKTIAKYLAERRADRENRINETINKLKELLHDANIKSSISGRAKHIYSIYNKMQKKHLDIKNVYDASAVRVLVNSIEDCYTALGIVNQFWENIPEEFDDYIANPKPNGYRSIHTAVIDSNQKNMEIQIRTFSMHDEAEHGIAAHWVYKENKQQEGYESKITFLRQLLDWHKDVAKEEANKTKLEQQFFEDRVYAFTPAGEILDLAAGATPLDFAYQIHTNLGNRCRGAKINGHIVPLTYSLKTGDQVEIITIKNGTPSRDWLSKDAGYIKTPRARAKIAQWFRHQDITQYVDAGRHSLEKEFNRAGIHHPNLQKIAAHFNYKDDDALFAAIGHGTLRPAQVSHFIQAELHHHAEHHHDALPIKKTVSKVINQPITGADDLLTRVARCCKPIPGDNIIGFITQGRGVSIHRTDCNNITHISGQANRLLNVAWDHKQLNSYFVELQVKAFGHENILKDISGLLTNLKINLISLNSSINQKDNLIYVTMTVQLTNLSQLHQISNALQLLSNVIDVKRTRE